MLIFSLKLYRFRNAQCESALPVHTNAATVLSSASNVQAAIHAYYAILSAPSNLPHGPSVALKAFLRAGGALRREPCPPGIVLG